MTAIVQAHEVGRWYGEVVGLNDLSVEIEPGITGLLGPNGAGKSTFMKLLVGELRPSRGSLRVLGMEPFANRALYQRLGFCPQQDALYDHLTGQEFVTVCMRLAGFSRAEASQRAAAAMQEVGLSDSMGRRCSEYSKGMRQRTRLAQAIAHDPDLLIVDEPLTGLDPIARHHTLELFRRLAEGGTSILLSSHVLHEVQSLTDRIVLIHRGRLLAQGSVQEIRSLISRHPRKLFIRARDTRSLAGALLSLDHVDSLSFPEPGSLSVETRNLDDLYRRLPALASKLRAGIRSMDSTDANLEAVFDYLVG